jgi:hypothetical protein
VAIAKVFGIETEYGIAAVGAPDFNPVLSSSLLISTYAGSLRRILRGRAVTRTSAWRT